MARHIFISYSKKDSEFAHKLADDLIASGHKVWIDRSLQVGEDWEGMIEQQIQDAQEVIVVLSEKSLISQWVLHEGSMAYALKKAIYPLIIDEYAQNNLPIWAQKTQFHSFINSGYEESFQLLNKALIPPNIYQDLLDQQVVTYKETGDLLGDALLGVIEANKAGLIFDESAKALFEKSKHQHSLLRKMKRRNQRFLYWGITLISILLVFSIFLTGNFFKQANDLLESQATAQAAATEAFEQQLMAEAAEESAKLAEATAVSSAEQAKAEAIISKSRELTLRSEFTKRFNFELAMILGIEAEKLGQNIDDVSRFESYRLLYQYSIYPLIKTVRLPEFQYGLVSAVYSPTENHILVETANDHIYLLDHEGDLITEIEIHGAYFTDWAHFNPKGDMILSSGKDATARVWDLEGKQLAVLDGGDGNVWSGQFSPDGKKIVTGSYDGIIKIWSLTGEKLVTIKGHDSGVRWVSFTPDGENVISKGGNDQTIRIWSMQGKELVKIEKCNYAPAISLDSKMLLTRCGDTPIQLRNIEGDILLDLDWSEEPQGNFEYTFSPDGTKFVVANSESYEYVARVWSIKGEELGVLEGHERIITSVSFTPDSKRIITSSWDDSIRVWDWMGTELNVLKGHTDAVISIDFGPHNNLIISSAADATLRFWNLDGDNSQVIKAHEGGVNFAEFDPAGEKIVTASSDGTAQIWNLNGEEIAFFEEDSIIYSPKFSPVGDLILTRSGDNNPRIWNINGELLAKLEGHTDYVNSASFSPNGRLIITASDDKTARIWDINGELLTVLDANSEEVIFAQFSPDGEKILTVESEMVRIWNLEGLQLATLHDDQLKDGQYINFHLAIFSPDSEKVLAIQRTKGHLWSLEGELLAILNHDAFWIWSPIFSPDGSRIVTVGEDFKGKVWDLNGNQTALLEGHTDRIRFVNFSPDGSMIVTASWDGTARIWNIYGDEIAVLEGHGDIVVSAEFSPDGKMILTTSLDDTVRLWPILSVEEMINIVSQKTNRDLTLDECIRYLDNYCKRWEYLEDTEF